MPASTYERLSFLDASFLALETPETHMHVGTIGIFEKGDLATPDGGLDFDRIRRHVESRLHLVPRYRQRLSWIPLEKAPVWVDDPHFNLDFHLRHTSLPAPGTEEQLKALTGRLMSQRLDRSKPLWELWIVEHVGEDRFGLVAKVHHCMIDGMSGVDLMAVLMDLMPVTEVAEPEAWTPRPAPSGAELVVGESARLTRYAIDTLRGAGRTAKEAAFGRFDELRERFTGRASAVAASLKSGWLNPSSETPINERIGPNRRFEWTEIPLDHVKAIKQTMGVTVNDVLLAISAGAIRRFLVEHRGFDVNGADVRAMVPVSVRAEGSMAGSGNQVAMWLVHLPVHEPDAESRLRFIHDQTEEVKSERHAEGALTLVQSAAATPTRMLAAGLKTAQGMRPFNLTITNVPGPPVPLYLQSARMERVYPVVPLWQYHGLGIALFSYCGTVHWGLMSDWDLVPDLDVFIDCIHAEAAELAALVAE